VLVGHDSDSCDTIRTGVTAVLPHAGNLFRDKVRPQWFVGNGFGKLAGSTQVNELGEIETPILLTSTLDVPACRRRANRLHACTARQRGCALDQPVGRGDE